MRTFKPFNKKNELLSGEYAAEYEKEKY